MTPKKTLRMIGKETTMIDQDTARTSCAESAAIKGKKVVRITISTLNSEAKIARRDNRRKFMEG